MSVVIQFNNGECVGWLLGASWRFAGFLPLSGMQVVDVDMRHCKCTGLDA